MIIVVWVDIMVVLELCYLYMELLLETAGCLDKDNTHVQRYFRFHQAITTQAVSLGFQSRAEVLDSTYRRVIKIRICK